MGNSCRKKNARNKLDKDLLEAAKAGSFARFQELVEQGADINATESMGDSALVLAARGGHTAIARYLFETRGAAVLADVKQVTEAMAKATKFRHVGFLRYLMAQPGVDVDATNEYGETALMKAAEKGHLDIVLFLTEECGADVNVITRYGQTALVKAAEGGHSKIVQYLAKRSADVSVEDKYGSTAIMGAVRHGHIDVVRYLAEECEADVNTDKSGTTPLMEAVRLGHLGIVQYLAEERGADVNFTHKDEHSGFTALMKAATYRYVGIVRYLVERWNVDVNVTDVDGNTALMRAASRGYADIVRYLAEESGADVNVKNSNGRTAIQLAAEQGHQEIQYILTPFLPLPVQRHISDRTRIRDAVPSSYKSSKWAIHPSEIALMNLSTKGNIGGEYRAKWLGADAVVKLFVLDVSRSEFEKEVQLWGELRHPNVIKMYGACDASSHLKFFVCEYASKGSLLEHIDSSAGKPMIWKFLHEAALGLEYLHERGIAHGDLRCSNILVGSDGLAKLSNFAVSSGVAASGVAGPLHWQAPEVLFWHRSPSFASDVYSLGMCIVEAVTGKRPWDSEAERQVISSKRHWTPEEGISWYTDLYAPPCPSKDARNLVGRMCCSDSNRRVRISSVVYELERLAIKENASNAQPESVPSHTFDDYRWEEMLNVWTDVELFMKACENSQYCQVFGEIKNVHERLLHSSYRQMLLARFHKLLTEFYWTVKMSPEQAHILRLSSTRAPSSSFYAFNWRIQSLLAALGDPARADKEREVRWQEQRSEQTDFFVAGVTDAYLLLQELKSTEERSAFLRRLKTQIDTPVSNYTPDQLCLMKNAYDDMVSKLETEDWSKLAPEWFIPWYELIIDKWSKLGSGGFGSVYQGTWLDSDVVVKLVGVDCDHDAFSLEYSTYESQVKTQITPEQRAKATTTFRREADIWFGLNHPHVIRLFGACHVGRPFFVCEYATNGTLVSYLQKHPDQLWTKLHEAALGVQYLHARNVVHGDLKGNNIVVGSDFKAKVTDFGLSSITDSEAKPEVSAAVHWVAPECLPQTKSKLQTLETERPTFASDIYSLGMCIVEALRVVEAVTLHKDASRCLPWGLADQMAVKYHVRQGKLPPRPTICDDRLWELVERMCVLNPKKRIKISTVVDELERLAYANNQEDELTTNSPTDLEHVPTVVAAARQVLTQLQQHTDQRVAELSLYRDLWGQLERIHGLIDASCGAAGRSAFSSLVADAELATQELPTRKANLTSLAESTLLCHALRRRLDKFCEACFLDME